MVESGAFEVSEEKMAEALEFGHEQIKHIIQAIKELHAQLKPKKVVVAPLPFDQAHLRQHEEELRREAARRREHRKTSQEGKLSPR